MSGLYEQSVKRARKASAKALAEAQRSYNLLEYTDSQYAREHRALIVLLKAVCDVWAKAPYTIERQNR